MNPQDRKLDRPRACDVDVDPAVALSPSLCLSDPERRELSRREAVGRDVLRASVRIRGRRDRHRRRVRGVVVVHEDEFAPAANESVAVDVVRGGEREVEAVSENRVVRPLGC